MPNEISEQLSIPLNNFLHRIKSKDKVLDTITQHGCHVKRIRRSRNWLLTGTLAQLKSLSAQLQESEIFWVSKVINKTIPKQDSENIALILKNKPTITVHQLVIETGCSLTEARIAIDNAEEL